MSARTLSLGLLAIGIETWAWALPPAGLVHAGEKMGAMAGDCYCCRHYAGVLVREKHDGSGTTGVPLLLPLPVVTRTACMHPVEG